MTLRPALVLPLVLAALPVAAQPPELPTEHVHPSGRFTFRTPADWRVGGSTVNPGAIEATDGGELLVRFLYDRGENGYDSRHVACMLERLAPEHQQSPHVEYEYDFLSGVVGSMRVLDSAFVITYDEPIRGQTRWRQRNVTLVGDGMSLCVITYAPEKVWKKQKPVRELLDAVLTSVRFREPG